MPSRGRKSGVAALLLIAATAGLAVWLKPSSQLSGPSILDRAKQSADGDGANAPLSSRILSNEDLPPAGTRSLFDHLVAQNNGLPYPFEALVEMVNRSGPADSAPVMLMIPAGRSLLKAQADFTLPRVLVAADYQAPATPASLGLNTRGQLFFGFVENAREIEVISYNEAAGRYEFQLVQDYAADGARRIVYARRAVCMTCHQGGTPIFPQRPWNETNAQPDIAERIVAARGAEPYLGVPVHQALSAPERFDELTDVGGFITTTQRIWLDGCADSAPCRRLLLKLGLRHAYDPGAFDLNAPEIAALRELQHQHWPAGGIAVPESDLRNRDPLAEKRGLRGWLRSMLVSEPEPGTGAKDNEDLAAFEQLPKLPAELDPLSLRVPKRMLGAADIDGVFGIAALISADDLRLLETAAGHQWPRVEAAIVALPDDFFAPAAFSRVRTMQSLLGTFAVQAPGYCCLDVSEMSEPVAINAPPVQLAAESPLQPFARHCFSCHRGNPVARLDFMAGADEAGVASNIRNKVEIRDALDWARYQGTDKQAKLMPPEDSAEHARLQAEMQDNPQLLEQMRAQVPGLFDF
ncbi:MAG: hypothetical protein M3O62_16345 [Pseudomonadota bacterium]|nr:hypothetical protein [Pseudomonadota bacterium]